jgi:hypothetical protein
VSADLRIRGALRSGPDPFASPGRRKVDCLDAQIDELARFRAQLVHVQRSLESAEPADQCGPGCGYDTDLPDGNNVPITLGRPASRSSEEPADGISCSLGPGDAAERVIAWRSVLENVEEREVTPQRVALRFPRDVELVGSLASLTAREVECCSFFSFALTLDARAVWLTIEAPAAAMPMVIELFGSFDG